MTGVQTCALPICRSPLDDDEIQNMHGVDMLLSPHHEEAAFCGACHDLSNPVFSLQADGTFMLNAMDAAHPKIGRASCRERV